MPETSFTPPPQWTASFEVGTLLWSFGKLAQRLLHQVTSDCRCRRRHQDWLDFKLTCDCPHCENEGRLTLIEYDFDSDGTVCLYARREPGTFGLVVHHTGFSLAVAILAEDQQEREIDALSIAQFEGDPYLAINWSKALLQWLPSVPPAPAVRDQAVSETEFRLTGWTHTRPGTC